MAHCHATPKWSDLWEAPPQPDFLNRFWEQLGRQAADDQHIQALAGAMTAPAVPGWLRAASRQSSS
jgi:hypothetical protein